MADGDDVKRLTEQPPSWTGGWSIPSKGQNGPRFAEIDAPVTHVPGAAELPPEKPHKKPTFISPAMLPVFADIVPITAISFDADDPRQRLGAYMVERWKIYLRREAREPEPWTTNAILANNPFCNVRRCDDRVSRWVIANIIEPFRNHLDLWFLLVAMRCGFNEPGALAEILPYLLPFDRVRCRDILGARKARRETVMRTKAYRLPTPGEGASGIAFVLNEVLQPIWDNREALRPRLGETCSVFGGRLEQCFQISGFRAAQVVADLKAVPPLDTAADWWTYARPGPGSKPGLNLVRGRDAKTSWTDAAWYHELIRLKAELTPVLIEHGLPDLDLQDWQNNLCEDYKVEGYRSGTRKSHGWLPAAEAASKPHKTRPKQAKTESPPEHVAAAIVAEAKAGTPPTDTDGIPAHILADSARSLLVEPAANGFDQQPRRHSSAGESPHGNSGTPRGQAQATFIYDHPDRPPPHFYLLVEKRLDAAGNRNFYQYRWEGGRWHLGVKGSYAERKVPYQLTALKAALAADFNTEVQIAEGEKDTDTLRRLGFVATTNPGGADHWSDDLTAWLRALGARRVVLHEDNDDAGRKRSGKLAAALSDFAAVHVARYTDVPEGEDVTYWVETLGHTKEELAARIAAAEPASAINFSDTPLTTQEWIARDLAEPDLLLGHILSTTARVILHADTGLGKTNFAMAASGHIGAGKDFLHWRCPRPRQVLYVDGEMSRKLFRERIADVARRLGELPAGAHFFSKEDMPGFAPLNTRDGQVMVWALIDEVERRSGQKLGAICFDSIMALLLGDMKEEDAWRDTLPLVHALTARQIGQMWVHHTGHDTSHGYGTKTREWQLDTVLHLDAIENKPPDLDVAFRLSFKKARERTPANRLDFVDTTITLSNDRWAGVIVSNARGKINESLTLKFFEALCAAADCSSVARTGPYPTASLDEWRAQCTAWGLLDPGKAHSARTLFSRHRLKLIATNWIACSVELAWALP